MTIQTVLFDADGVTQYNWVFMERMSKLLNGQATLEEISDVEHPILTGERDFDADPQLAALVEDLRDEIARLRATLRRFGG